MRADLRGAAASDIANTVDYYRREAGR